MTLRNAALLAVGFFLILVQANLYRVFGPIGAIEVAGTPLSVWLHGTTPNLVLPLVIYLGVHEQSMARGALLSFGLGWQLDVLGAAPTFLFRFTFVVLWWLSRIASSRLSAQTFITRLPLAFLASVAESAIVLTLLAIFGADNRVPQEIASIVFPRALGTALCAPFVFALAQRLQVEGRPPQGQAPGNPSATAS